MGGSCVGCDAFWLEDPLPVTPYAFDIDCQGLLRTIQHACRLSNGEHPIEDRYQPYYGYPVSRAVWCAKYVMREARRMGLYPSTAQLEAETRKAA